MTESEVFVGLGLWGSIAESVPNPVVPARARCDRAAPASESLDPVTSPVTFIILKRLNQNFQAATIPNS